MYSQEELNQVSVVLSIMAAKNGISEEQMRKEIQEAISYARSNSVPKAREMWKNALFAEDNPSVEEFIMWLANEVKKKAE